MAGFTTLPWVTEVTSGVSSQKPGLAGSPSEAMVRPSFFSPPLSAGAAAAACALRVGGGVEIFGGAGVLRRRRRGGRGRGGRIGPLRRRLRGAVDPSWAQAETREDHSEGQPEHIAWPEPRRLRARPINRFATRTARATAARDAYLRHMHMPAPLVDPFQRAIRYLRVSVTDRCDFRCTYCMSEHMTFLPKKELLTLEELDRLCSAFVGLGVEKLRITGGEPLVRKDILTFFRAMSRHLDSGALKELTLTTNGSQLARFAPDLAAAGVKRINVSLDTLDETKFAEITRWGRLAQVLHGIDAAQAAGLKVKINTVALKGFNEDELFRLQDWCAGRGMDLTFIEVMPMGDFGAEDRLDQYWPVSDVRARLAERFRLTDLSLTTGGPARYVRVEETGQRIGFITPLDP